MTTSADDQIGFELLLRDGPCLVVNKPPGLLTQAPPGIDWLERRVRDWLQARHRAADPDARAYLGVPHRLDRPASGALLLATSRRAARRLSEQFEMRLVEKRYWALVAGRVEPEVGTWEDFIRKIPGRAAAEVVPPEHPEGRIAVMHYRVLRRDELADRASRTWLEIELETGRTHQIRLQCASRGHPIRGDSEYGSTAVFGPVFDDARRRAIALHGRRIAFDHPRDRRRIEVEAPTPGFWPPAPEP